MAKNNDTRDHIAYSSVEKAQDVQSTLGPAPRIGKRHLQCFLYFLIMLIAYGFRVNLSVAIVAMTDKTPNNNTDIPTYPHWTQKGAILSAFFWGYIWPQILAGYVANRFGAKWFLVATMATQSSVGFCTPYLASYFGEKGVMIGRVIQGLCQGFLFPSITHLLSQWAPHEERARMTSFTYGAVPFGTVVAMLVSGALAATKYGWPMIFYVYGSCGVLVSILFAILGHNSPSVDPTISKAERYYIENSLGHTEKKHSHKVPYKAIATSVPVWALLITQCGNIFGFWILLTQIPTYMKFVLNFNIKSNSLLSSLPYITLFVLSLPVSYISDWVINKGYLKQSTSRKVFNSIGVLIPCVALIMMGYIKSNEATKAVWLLIVAVGLSAISGCGWSLNHMDLSPNHAGTLMGICNGLSNILAAFAPLSVQFLVKDETDPAQWRIIFFLAAGVQIFCGLVFNIFGKAEVQPWNDDTEEDPEEKK